MNRPLSSQELGDLLLAQWQLLWPLSPSERLERIDQVRLDYLFEQQLALVTREMECVS